MSNPKVELLVQMLESAREQTLKTAGSVPESNRLLQLQEGKATPLWLVGHLANTLNTIVLRWMIEGEGIFTREQSKRFSPDFAAGDPPSTDSSKYPPWEEVVGLYRTAMDKAIAGARALTDAELAKPLKGKVPPPLDQFFSSNGTSLMIMINHDAYHRGQIGLLAKLNRPE
jgi:hypothetical protein